MGNSRIRMTLTDGFSSISSMLTQQLNSMFHENILRENCLVVLGRYITQPLNGAK